MNDSLLPRMFSSPKQTKTKPETPKAPRLSSSPGPVLDLPAISLGPTSLATDASPGTKEKKEEEERQ